MSVCKLFGQPGCEKGREIVVDALFGRKRAAVSWVEGSKARSDRVKTAGTASTAVNGWNARLESAPRLPMQGKARAHLNVQSILQRVIILFSRKTNKRRQCSN